MLDESTREAPQNLGSALKSIISRYGEMKAGMTIDEDGEAIEYNKVDTALKSVGISIKDAQGQFRDFDDVIFELSEKWDSLDSISQRYLATILAGNRQQSRFIALVSDYENLKKISEAAADSEDAALLQYAKTLDSLDAKVNQFNTAVQNLYAGLGLEDWIKGAVDAATAMINAINNMGTLGGITKLMSMFQTLRDLIIFGVHQIKAQMSDTSQISSAYTQLINEKMKEIRRGIETVKQAQKQASDEVAQHDLNNTRQNAEEKEQIANGQTSSQTQPVVERHRRSDKYKDTGETKNLLTKITSNFKTSTLVMASSFVNILGTAGDTLANSLMQSGNTVAANWTKAGSAIATGASIILDIATQNWFGVIIKGISLISSTFTWIANQEKMQIEALEKAVEDSNLKRAESKAEYDELVELKERYDELSTAQYDSIEAKEEWLAFSNEIASKYPELISYIDQEGNAVIELGDAYDEMAKKKKSAYQNQTAEYYGNEYKLSTAYAQQALDSAVKQVSHLAYGGENDDAYRVSTAFAKDLSFFLANLNLNRDVANWSMETFLAEDFTKKGNINATAQGAQQFIRNMQEWQEIFEKPKNGEIKKDILTYASEQLEKDIQSDENGQYLDTGEVFEQAKNSILSGKQSFEEAYNILLKTLYDIGEIAASPTEIKGFLHNYIAQSKKQEKLIQQGTEYALSQIIEPTSAMSNLNRVLASNLIASGVEGFDGNEDRIYMSADGNEELGKGLEGWMKAQYAGASSELLKQQWAIENWYSNLNEETQNIVNILTSDATKISQEQFNELIENADKKVQDALTEYYNQEVSQYSELFKNKMEELGEGNGINKNITKRIGEKVDYLSYSVQESLSEYLTNIDKNIESESTNQEDKNAYSSMAKAITVIVTKATDSTLIDATTRDKILAGIDNYDLSTYEGAKGYLEYLGTIEDVNREIIDEATNAKGAALEVVNPVTFINNAMDSIEAAQEKYAETYEALVKGLDGQQKGWEDYGDAMDFARKAGIGLDKLARNTEGNWVVVAEEYQQAREYLAKLFFGDQIEGDVDTVLSELKTSQDEEEQQLYKDFVAFEQAYRMETLEKIWDVNNLFDIGNQIDLNSNSDAKEMVLNYLITKIPELNEKTAYALMQMLQNGVTNLDIYKIMKNDTENRKALEKTLGITFEEVQDNLLSEWGEIISLEIGQKLTDAQKELMGTDLMRELGFDKDGILTNVGKFFGNIGEVINQLSVELGLDNSEKAKLTSQVRDTQEAYSQAAKTLAGLYFNRDDVGEYLEFNEVATSLDIADKITKEMSFSDFTKILAEATGASVTQIMDWASEGIHDRVSELTGELTHETISKLQNIAVGDIETVDDEMKLTLTGLIKQAHLLGKEFGMPAEVLSQMMPDILEAIEGTEDWEEQVAGLEKQYSGVVEQVKAAVKYQESMTESDKWDIFGQDNIHDNSKNAVKLAESLGNAFEIIDESVESGTMSLNDYWGLMKLAAEGRKAGGGQEAYDVFMEQAAQFAEAAGLTHEGLLNLTKGFETETIDGIGLATFGESMKTEADAGIKAMAQAEVDYLDGMIKMLETMKETETAMQKLETEGMMGGHIAKAFNDSIAGKTVIVGGKPTPLGEALKFSYAGETFTFDEFYKNPQIVGDKKDEVMRAIYEIFTKGNEEIFTEIAGGKIQDLTPMVDGDAPVDVELQVKLATMGLDGKQSESVATYLKNVFDNEYSLKVNIEWTEEDEEILKRLGLFKYEETGNKDNEPPPSGGKTENSNLPDMPPITETGTTNDNGKNNGEQEKKNEVKEKKVGQPYELKTKKVAGRHIAFFGDGSRVDYGVGSSVPFESLYNPTQEQLIEELAEGEKTLLDAANALELYQAYLWKQGKPQQYFANPNAGGVVALKFFEDYPELLTESKTALNEYNQYLEQQKYDSVYGHPSSGKTLTEYQKEVYNSLQEGNGTKDGKTKDNYTSPSGRTDLDTEEVSFVGLVTAAADAGNAIVNTADETGKAIDEQKQKITEMLNELNVSYQILDNEAEEGFTIALFVDDSKGIEKFYELKQKLQASSIVVPVSIYQSSSNAHGNSKIRKTHYGDGEGFASGHNNRGTLVGELGPELAVYNGQYHILGQNGAEFTDLPSDAIVFNHKQTKALLAGKKNVRGMALAEGNVSGPAAASGIDSALAALKNLRAMWESIANSSISDLAGKAGGGGGGGGGGESIKAQSEDLQEWYNLMRQIELLEKSINNLEAERANITDGREYVKNLRQQQELLERQVKTQEQLLKYQRDQLALEADQINNHEIFSKFINVNLETGLLQYNEGNEEFGGKGTLQVLAELNNMSGEDQLAFLTNLGYSATNQDGEELEGADLIKQFFEDYDTVVENYTGLFDTVVETKDTLENLETSINEINEEIRQNQLDLEQNVFDAIEGLMQKQIDTMEEQLDLTKEANDAYIAALEESLAKEKERYSQNTSQAELDTLQRRLALLQRSGGSATEIRSLQSEIEQKNRDQYFEKMQQQIDAVQEASDKQIEAMERQIKVQEEQLAYEKEHGIIWNKVYDTLAKDDQDILKVLTSGTQAVSDSSALAIEEMIKDWMKSIGIYKGDEGKETEKASTGVDVNLTKEQKQEKKNNENNKNDKNNTTGNSKTTSTTKKKKHWYNGKAYNSVAEGQAARAEKVAQIEADLRRAKSAYGWIVANGGSNDTLKNQIAKLEADKIKYEDMRVLYYKSGGVNDTTGFAWLDGTKSKPEGILNAEDYAAFKQLVANYAKGSRVYDLSSIAMELGKLVKVAENNESNTLNINEGAIQITINGEADELDANAIGEAVKNSIVDIARKSGNLSLSRR